MFTRKVPIHEIYNLKKNILDSLQAAKNVQCAINKRLQELNGKMRIDTNVALRL